MKNKNQFFILSIPVILILLVIFWLVFLKKDSNERVFVGLFETTQIRVASEIPGRIDKIYVKLGDQVKQGQLLASIESDILDAKIQQAEGVLTAAESQNEKAINGARIQQINTAKNSYEMAKSQFEFADKSYSRINALQKDSLIPAQEFDEIAFKRSAAEEQMLAAKSMYEMALEGARIEDKKAVKGQLSAVEGQVKEAKAFYKELKILAPIDGEVSEKLAEEKEVMPAGYPIFTLQKLEDIYATLHIREDYLKYFTKGSIVQGILPAFENRIESFEVTFISPMADFADWIPTADKGRLDMKTFEIRLTPVRPIENLRPGMSVNVKI